MLSCLDCLRASLFLFTAWLRSETCRGEEGREGGREEGKRREREKERTDAWWLLMIEDNNMMGGGVWSEEGESGVLVAVG